MTCTPVRPARSAARLRLAAWVALLAPLLASVATPLATTPLAAAPPPFPAAGPADGPAPGVLVESALDLEHHGDPLQAWTLLLQGIDTGLDEPAEWSRREEVEWEAATWLLTDLVGRTGTWTETLERLLPHQPWPAHVPAGTAFRLDHLIARALRRAGRADEARGVIERLGYLTDWYVAGPFDNERGRGLDTPYEPERVFDRTRPMQGKEREVTWRNMPGRHHPLALVALDAMLRPDEQAVAYLATALQPRDPGAYELRIGSSGPYRLFMDGELVGSRDAERPFGPDQDRHLVHLHEGWNQLLVKLGNEEGPWTFAARFADLDGRPMQFIQCEAVYTAWPHEPPTEDEAALIFYGVEPERRGAPEDGSWASARPTPPLPAARPGPREVLAAADDPQAARLVVLHDLLVHPQDRTDEAPVEAARRAVQAEPGSALAAYLLAEALRPRGQSRNEIEVNRRLHALQDVLDLDPTHVAARLELARFWLAENPIPSRADALTAEALAMAPASWEAHRLRADVLASQGRGAEAELLRRAAEALPAADHSSAGQLARARRLANQGQPDGALAVLLAAAERNVLSRPLVDELCRALADAGDNAVDDLLRITERGLAAEPFDLARMITSARLLEHADDEVKRYRGREYIEQVLGICPEHVPARRHLVRMDERFGLEEEAAEGLREILRLEPGDDRARRHLKLLTEGEERRFEDPYRWDAAELLDLPLPEGAGNDPLECLRRTVVWRVEPDGTEHEYQHVALRVLTDGGARRLDVYPLVGEGDSRVYVYGVRVLRADGSVEAAPAPRTRGRVRYYDLPPLRPGDVVDVEYRADQLAPDVFGEYFGIRHDFYPDRADGLAPTRHSELVVLSPPGVELYSAVRNGAALEHSSGTDEEGQSVRRWVARDLPRPRVESAMPRIAELVPQVDVTTFRDWDDFADWWWHFIEKEFVTTPAMSEKVAELTAGLETEAEKIEAIARFVGQEIRYNAWAFGTHGYEPYSAPTIFERRFGDCKDKSILLRQLLAEVGVEAIPVLIKAESPRTDESLDAAMVGHFNHCIAYLPPTDERGGLYLDATADRNPVGYLREDDQGARVLHVSEAGGELRDIPFAAPDENTMRREYRVALDATGAGVVELEDDSNGSFGVRMRYRFGGESDDPGEVLARWLSRRFGALSVEQLETSDLEDIGEPARVSARFRADGIWSAQAGRKALPVTFEDLDLESVAVEAPDSRGFDVVLPRPFAQQTRIVYALPEAGRLLELPESVRIEEPGLVTYQLDVERTEEGVVVERRFSLETARVPRDRYGAFRDALDRVRQAEDKVILLEVELGP